MVFSPARLILQFAIPLLFGSLFQQMYNMVDTIIVGRFLGVDALAAVGATGSLNFMMVGFCVGCCSGFSVPVAQRFGARDMHDLRCYVGNGVWLSLLFTVVMTLAMTLLCRPILQLMSTPDNILDMAYDYLVVIFLGIPAIVLYNYLSSILRAVGDSRTPVYFLIVTSILNVVLDLLLVVVIPWGVAGAAWATVLSQAVSGVLCLIYMLKKTDLLKISADEWKISAEHQKVLINMGVPMGLQFSITAIGSVILQSAVNTLGSVAVASTTAASRLSTLFVCPYECLGNTMATYAGQNLGAGKIHRVRQGCKQATIFAAIYSAAAIILMWFLGRRFGANFYQRGRETGTGLRGPIFTLEQRVVFLAGRVVHSASADSGRWIYQTGDFLRRVRNDRSNLCSAGVCPGVWLCRSMCFQPHCLGVCRLLFDSRLFGCDEAVGFRGT